LQRLEFGPELNGDRARAMTSVLEVDQRVCWPLSAGTKEANETNLEVSDSQRPWICFFLVSYLWILLLHRLLQEENPSLSDHETKLARREFANRAP
jgi:hypothetical protein